jgi:hypothetical protein
MQTTPLFVTNVPITPAPVDVVPHIICSPFIVFMPCQNEILLGAI